MSEHRVADPRPCWKCTMRLVRNGQVGCRRALYKTCGPYQTWQKRHPQAPLPGQQAPSQPVQPRLSAEDVKTLKNRVLVSVAKGNVDRGALMALVRNGDQESIKLAREYGLVK